MFKEPLAAILANTEDSLGVMIMGMDGISVETLLSAEGESSNLDIAAAELSSLVRHTQRAGRNVDLGALQEMTFRFARVKFLVRMVGEEYFIILALNGEGNIGRGHYELRKAEMRLAREFKF